MKVKIDTKHRIRIPNQLWEACNFTENEEVDLTVNKFGELTVGKINEKRLTLKYITGLQAEMRPDYTTSEILRDIEQEYRCIVTKFELVAVNIIEFDVVCDTTFVGMLKRRYGKK